MLVAGSANQQQHSDASIAAPKFSCVRTVLVRRTWQQTFSMLWICGRYCKLKCFLRYKYLVLLGRDVCHQFKLIAGLFLQCVKKDYLACLVMMSQLNFMQVLSHKP